MKTSSRLENPSRRRIMAVAGGLAGAAALSAVGFPAHKLHGNNSIAKVQLDTIETRFSKTEVLVIGSGIAGLFAAVKAHDAGAKVLMVSKGRLGSSGQTPFAKGIFAYDPSKEKMSIGEFVDAVSQSALGTNNKAYTRQMVEHSLARVNELQDWGFFDSPLYNKSFSRPIKERDISMQERIVVTHLLKENQRISGAAGFDLDQGTIHIFSAKSVILCTGAGGFKPNGFPICDLTHDGTVMAYDIGAKVTGKEWNDGHPGQMNNPAACFDGWHGMFERKPGITGIGIRHDLGMDLNYKTYVTGPNSEAPHKGNNNDKLQGGPFRPMGFQDPGPPDGERPGGGPPHTAQGGKRKGPPPGMGRNPVGGSSAGMAIHKSEGLVPINDRCESTIPGLYAAGDALGSYMAGAIYTRIGSSLAGSAVQGAVAAEAAAKYCQRAEFQPITKKRMKEVKQQILAPLDRSSGYSPAWVTHTLQGIMIPNFVLYIKKESLLKAALAYVEELRDHYVPKLRASDMHELRLAHETRNMVVSAEMKLRASLLRKESRCSHYRLDYPEVDEKNWQAWINIYKAPDGAMKMEKQQFDRWPA